MNYIVYIYRPNGTLLSTYSAYEIGLGIKTLNWMPSSQFLVIGSYDQKIRFINTYTWKESITMDFPDQLQEKDITVYKETNVELTNKWERALNKNEYTCI